MSYSGSCHCGAVSFTVDAEIPDSAISCNCSHCRRKGFLLTFVPATQFTLDGNPEQTEYRFNTHKIAHRFCKECGCEAYAEGVDKDGNETRMVNLRCVPDCELESLDIQKFDGASR